MLKKTFSLAVTFGVCISVTSQILGGGTQFSNAVLFNQAWLNGCPDATLFSNEPAFEPTTAIDPCAPAPACVTGTAISDVWFSFYAQSSTAAIVVNPGATFNVAIQAFSGNACPGLTDIGCADAGGIGVTETLNLTGLTFNQLYYFRIFGSSDNVSNRTGTGTYTFCQSTQLGGILLAVEISNFNASKQNNNVLLNWTTESESNNAYFGIERSSNGNFYEPIGKVAGVGTTTSTTHYNFTDVTPLTTPVSYYRLKQINNNGGYQYSAVAIVKQAGALEKSVVILSNPVTNGINVKVNSDEAANINLKVINNLGQFIHEQKGILVKGENIFKLSGTGISNLPKGIYTLQVMINQETLNTRFISVK